MGKQEPHEHGSFHAEVARIRASATLGEGGRLLELFDFLAGRGADTPSASQSEIAERVFGQTETSVDDATVRVYIHRLRKRLDDFYAASGDGPGGARLTLPSGTYALRLARENGEAVPVMPEARPGGIGSLVLVVAALAVVAGAFLLGRTTSGQGDAPPANALWQPFLDSPRPKLIVVGDYYIYGEISPVEPEKGRLIRDFRVNSPADLELMQDLEPARYGNAEDVGLNYLPVSAAYGLEEIVPILRRDGRQVRVIAASQVQADMLNHFDVVFLGLFSGMGLLEDINFMGSGFTLGESYDELQDRASGKTFVSEEAQSLASPVYYRDYGYVARFHSPGGALVAVVAGERDTGLRGVAPIAARGNLPGNLEKLAAGGDFEALYQITGQQGADLAETLLLARKRR